MKFNFTAVVLLLILFNCSPIETAGGSTNTSNARVCGTIIGSDALPAQKAVVYLISSDYTPFEGIEGKSILEDTTDKNGNYSFTDIPEGNYTIEAVHLRDFTKLFIDSFHVDSSYSDSSRVDTLKKPVIKVVISVPDSCTEGFVYLAGTVDGFAKVWGKTAVIFFVAQGKYQKIYYINKSGDTPVELYNDVSVDSSDSVLVSRYMSWKGSAKIFINTSLDGADVKGNVTEFPLLVRLNSSSFDFKAAQSDGSDLRFSRPDFKPLDYQIEYYDNQNGEAAVWVRVDTVYGNKKDQFIYMYWGNQSATHLSNGEQVFDTSLGYQGVWHMDGDRSKTVYDATANHFNGTAINMTGGSYTTGVTGSACIFNNDSQYIQIEKSAKSKLNFPKDGDYTLSAWAYLDTLDTLYQCIIGKGWLQYQLEKGNLPGWELAECQDGKGWERTRSEANAGVWTLVTGVHKGTNQYLYVNGVCTDSTIEVWPSKEPYDNSHDVTIGNILGDEVDRPYCFRGKIDEVRMLDRVCSSDWIKLCYMNQALNSKVISILRK